VLKRSSRVCVVCFFFVCVSICCLIDASVEIGVDVFFSDGAAEALRGKRVGLITNHTGMNKRCETTFDLFAKNQKGFFLTAVFAPEHGFFGRVEAGKSVEKEKQGGQVIYSLHGKTRRPTEEMLRGIDVLIYDIQDIGTRCYTYATTLYYVMEEAAKKKIPVVVLDRPNPLGGNLVDGPMLEPDFRSFIGYIDVPFCHGMTIGELARYFNGEYKIGCDLSVIPMKGWKRKMSFQDTGLLWIPTSPNIPEKDTPIFSATTGLIGELGIVSIGIGSTLPFKVVGAPWICGRTLAKKLQEQHCQGIQYVPFHFRPQYGMYAGEDCEGILLVIKDLKVFKPVMVQHLILGVLKSLYPDIISKKLAALSKDKKDLFCKAEGGEGIFAIYCKEKYPAWKMVEYQSRERQEFLEKRKKYLLYN
jgi:uncharacterized protein YbbC (DUF1343 family)